MEMSSDIVTVWSCLGKYIVEISSVLLLVISRRHYVHVDFMASWFLQSICLHLPSVPQALWIIVVIEI